MRPATALALLVLLLPGLAPPPATAEDDLAARILASRAWGHHGLGFGAGSMAQLRRDIRVTELPAVIRLLDSERNSLGLGAQVTLAAHCEAGLDAMAAALRTPRLAPAHLGSMQQALLAMQDSGHCSKLPAERVAALQQALGLRGTTLQAQQAASGQQQQAEAQRLQNLGLILLDPARRHEVSRSDCEQIVMRAAAGMGRAQAEVASDPLLSRSLQQCAGQAEQVPSPRP